MTFHQALRPQVPLLINLLWDVNWLKLYLLPQADSSSLVDRGKRRSQMTTFDDHVSKSRKRSTSLEEKEDKVSRCGSTFSVYFVIEN